MKQITNKEYEEWQKYKAEKAKGHILLPDTVRFICEANGYDAEKIGQHFLEILPKITEQGDGLKLWQIYRSWILCTMLCRRGAFFAGFALTHRDNDDRRDAIVLRLPKSSLLHLFRARAVADLLFAKAAKRCSFRNAWIGSFERHSFLP